jgi:hypothetical protein
MPPLGTIPTRREMSPNQPRLLSPKPRRAPDRRRYRLKLRTSTSNRLPAPSAGMRPD